MKIFFGALCFFSFFSCGPIMALNDYKKVEKELKNLIDESHKNCVLLEGEDCSFSFHVFSKKEPLSSSLGQRILIIDSEREPAFKSMFFKNKGKVLELYKLKKEFSGKLESFRPVISAPSALISFFERVGEIEKEGGEFEKIKIDSFKLLKLHHKIKTLIPEAPGVAHGEYIFDFLSKYNPEAQFAIGPFPELEDKDFCSMSFEPEKVKSFFEEAAKSYLEIIKKHKINYVNLSYASTYYSVSRHNREMCSGSLSHEDINSYLEHKTKFLDALEEGAPEVLFFQALPNEYERSYLKKESSNSFSCKERSNFFRVSYWSYPILREREISDRRLKKYLPLNQRRLWNFSDLYVNSGFKEGEGEIQKSLRERPLLEVLYFGFYPSPSFNMSNSFATPIALSYVNYLKQKEGRLFFSSRFLRKKIIDPILNHQLLN